MFHTIPARRKYILLTANRGGFLFIAKGLRVPSVRVSKLLPLNFGRSASRCLLAAQWVGTNESMSLSFSSSCHGAGRNMSRHEATRRWHGKDVVKSLEQKGILIRSPSFRGVAEEAPEAYKDVDEVVEAAHGAKLSWKVAKLLPLICVKG
jgi:hypothetical protein